MNRIPSSRFLGIQLESKNISVEFSLINSTEPIENLLLLFTVCLYYFKEKEIIYNLIVMICIIVVKEEYL